MIAFALIAIGCVPATADLVREFRYWATASQATRRRMLYEAGLTALCWVALAELWLRFTVDM